MIQTKIASRESGKGPAILLLHGYAGSVLHWDLVVSILNQSHRVLVPNLTHLYMGTEPFKFSQQVDAIAEFIQKAFPGKKIHVAGISYGGALAWGLALKYPEIVDQIILINPMPPSPVDTFSLVFLKWIFKMPLNKSAIYWLLQSSVGRTFLSQVATVFRLERAELWQHRENLSGRKLMFISHIIQRFFYIMKSENWDLWKERMDLWAHRSLMIYDVQDPLYRPQTYQIFQEMIMCDEVVELHQAGHIAIQSQGPEIAHIIIRFLNVKAGSTAA